jgi:hypothetical protein
MRFEGEQILRPLSSAHEQHKAILLWKLRTLLRSAEEYLELALKTADVVESQQEELRARVLGSPEFLADQKLQLQLLARHGAARTRGVIEGYLEKTVHKELQETMKNRLTDQLPKWRGGFSNLLLTFQRWLRSELNQELGVISSLHSKEFCEPLREVERQCQRNLQSFRDQLSEKVMRTFGVPLRTTETEIEVQPPRAPDISVGQVFDHSWEIISLLIPMPLVRWAVERRFYEKTRWETHKNISRMTTQWEEIVQAAIFKTAKEAERRFDELIGTIGRLLSGADEQSKSRITSYLDQIKDMLKHIPQ